ncbi:MAG TPA: hypothetical protein VHX38_30045 [Pseudonocardiaceae bacterium]|nr:hypothetical protein [Pseudonocardiaceae bacterium]
MNSAGQEPALLPWQSLAPYLSIIMLSCTAKDPKQSFDAVRDQLLKDPVTRGRKRSRAVALGEVMAAPSGAVDGVGELSALGLDQIFGYIREVESTPAWSVDADQYINTTYELNLVVRRKGLLAVKVGDSVANSFQRWLDKAPVPPVTRIAPRLLQHTFLTGEAKGLWLQHAGGRSKRRPDSRASAGIDLRDTLDPFDESAYSLGTARCGLPDDPGRVMLKGAVGSTLRASQLWLKPMPDLASFLTAIGEVFDLIGAAPENEEDLIEAFPEFAKDVLDLSEVSGAYDVALLDVSQLPPTLAGNEEIQEGAALLQDAVLRVAESSSLGKFKVEVELHKKGGGLLSVTPRSTTHGYTLDIGLSGEPDYLPVVQPVLDALQTSDLLVVYYESGHVYSGGNIFKPNTMIAPFKNWCFRDFEGYDIETEKPFNLLASKEIHRKTASDGDNSLFAWVVKNFSDGWLICDDGSGETADFLQISSEGVLRIIHVKGAESSAPGRQISTGAYELVTSQASKNLIFLDKDRLARQLAATAQGKASWQDGERVDSRDEFIEMLHSWTVRQGREIIIVQPHISKPAYYQAHEDDDQDRVSPNLLRLRRLETLLNSARSSIVKSGADLWVIASDRA